MIIIRFAKLQINQKADKQGEISTRNTTIMLATSKMILTPKRNKNAIIID